MTKTRSPAPTLPAPLGRYYIIQLLEADDGSGKFYCWNRWGRVGEERGYQNALRGPMGLAEAKAE